MNDADKTAPNDSQISAIESSLNDFLSIIWGPPGTGKTLTIAKAIEEHLKLGRRILLVSHANNAVDQALDKVAEEMRDTFYKEGKLLRLGTPKTEMLTKFQADKPLLLLENIVALYSKPLLDKHQILNKKVGNLNYKIKEVEKSIGRLSDAGKLYREFENEKERSTHLKAQLEVARNHISKIMDDIDSLNTKLNIANNSNTFQRFFKGLNPQRIRQQINYKEGILKNQHLELTELKKTVADSQIKYVEVKDKLDKVLQNLKMTINEFPESIQHKKNEISNYQKEKSKILDEIKKIDEEIEKLKTKIINESKVIATTLTKSYISRELESQVFDVLIVDEISMAPMPMIYWAISKATKGITLVGDFFQLPPIVISREDTAKKWLGRSIFNELKIDSINDAFDQKINLLNTQYRMHPFIAKIPNENIYGSKLLNAPNTKSNIIEDEISESNSVCLIDTSAHKAWCSQMSKGRFNLINALVSISLAEIIINENNNTRKTIGIITPYRNQARLLLRLAEDKNLLDKNLRINTIHSFQGGEETIIIFDSVDAEGAKRWSFINEYDNTESAKLLINVAITRAKCKLYVIANLPYLRSHFKTDTMFMKLVSYINQTGITIKSDEILDSFDVNDFQNLIYPQDENLTYQTTVGKNFDQNEFWSSFPTDILRAKEEVIIFSPFVTENRVNKLLPYLRKVVQAGVKTFVITLPPNQHPRFFDSGSARIVNQLKNEGIYVKFRPVMHEKIAIIDKNIKWFGSLNILSHNERTEYMERLEGEKTTAELYNKFNLKNFLYNYTKAGDNCPRCTQNSTEGYIIVQQNNKTNRYFYCCSNRGCNWTENIRLND